MRALGPARVHVRRPVQNENPRPSTADGDMITEAPQLTLSNVDIPMDSTGRANGQLKEHNSPDVLRNVPIRLANGRAGERVCALQVRVSLTS